jgi:hypothetical protein
MGIAVSSIVGPDPCARNRQLGDAGRSDGLHTQHPAVLSGRQHGPLVQQTVTEIRVLRDRLAERSAALAAHDLGDAWLALNALADLPRRITEACVNAVPTLVGPASDGGSHLPARRALKTRGYHVIRPRGTIMSGVRPPVSTR